MQKKFIGVLILLIVIAGVFYFTQDNSRKLKPLPTKDNPSSSGLYANILPFEEWRWKRDGEGTMIYKIKFPPIDGGYIMGSERLSAFNNILRISIFRRDARDESNIKINCIISLQKKIFF